MSDKSHGGYLLLSALIGAVVLGIEVLAGRSLAPSIGTGSVAWAAVLAVALGTLAGGNLLGGLAAEHSSAESVAMGACTVSATAVAALSQVWHPVVSWAAGLHLVAGALAAAAVTQFAPMLMLGMVSPAVLRVGESQDRRSIWHGMVLACGSLGGIGGAMTVSLWSLPSLGLSRSYLLLATALTLCAIPLAWRERRWRMLAALLGLAAIILILWPHSGEAEVVQSRHGQIEVRHEADSTILLIDGLPQTAFPCHLEKWAALKDGYLLEALLVQGERPRTALVIGLGAGLAPRILAMHNVDCESVEIDSRVVDAARAGFGFHGNVTIADGRVFLRGSSNRWDWIFLDVCTSERLPLHLLSVEALLLVKRRLSRNGILAVQFVGDDGRWSASIRATVARIFGKSTVCVSSSFAGPVGPRWVFAGRGAAAALTNEWATSIRGFDAAATDGVLTDDRCPTERDWALAGVAWRRAYGFD